MKSKLVSAALSIVLVFSSLVAPVTAQDSTVDALRQQIQMLLAQVAALQAQLAKSSEQPTSCPNITYNLYLGLNDSATQGQISQLQKYLANDSSVYPEASITGYFGPLTEQAVQRFQSKNSIVSSGSPDTTGYGVVGRATRGKIREMCGTTTPPPLTPSITVLSPNGGETWVVGTEYTISWSNRGFNPQNIKVYLYRESSGQTLISEMLETSAWQTTLKYTVPSSITVARDYKILVCDEGTETPAGKYLCDMSDTTFSMVQAGGSNSPIISGVSGPTSLIVGQSGTWTVNARDPNGGTLSYSVNWGDESSALTPTSSGGQTASFTHTYTRQGVFNPIFTVSNSSGSQRTSVSVDVGGAPVPVTELLISPVQGLDRSVILGANDTEFAQIILDATNATEDIRVITTRIFADVITGDLDNYQNLRLYDGSRQLNTGSNVVNPSGTPVGSDKELVFSLNDSLIVSKGSTKTILLKGNLATTLNIGDAIKFDFSGFLSSSLGWEITGAVTGKSMTHGFSTVPGSIIKIATSGDWQVRSAPSQPSEKWVTAGSQGVVSSVLRFAVVNEDMALANLRLQLRQPERGSDIAKIYLYDGSTLITSKVPSFVNGVEDFVFPMNGVGSFMLPKDSYKEMTIKIDLPAIGSNQPGVAGRFVAVDFDGDGTALGKNTAVGMLSGSSIRTSTNTDVLSNGVRYFRSLPVFERLVTPTTILVNGSNVLYKFRVTAQNGDVALRKMVFQAAITGTGGVSLSNITLWNTTDNKRVNTAFSPITTSPLNIKIFADSSDYATPYIPITRIPGTKTFELRADVSFSGNMTLSTRLMGDTQYPVLSTPMGTAAEVEASPSSSIIWSDFSADTYSTHSLTTKDWTNGFKLPGLLSTGLDSSTLSGDGVNPPPSITVLSPNGGEVWEVGKTYQIKWQGSAESLYVWKSNQAVGTPVHTVFSHPGSADAGGVYSWTIPSNSYLTPGTYIVQVVGCCSDINSNVPTDNSNAPFNIIAASTASPDLSLESVSFPTTGVTNQELVLTFNVINRGNAPFHWENYGHGVPWKVGVSETKQRVISDGCFVPIIIVPSAGCSVKVGLTFANTGAYYGSVVVDPSTVIADSNRTNNVFGNVKINISQDSLPGTVWRLELLDKWTGAWTRKTGTDIFNAVYSRPFSTTVMGTVAPKLTGSTITVPATTFSDGNICSYTGTLALDRKSITGTYTCTIGGTRVWKVLIDPPVYGISSATPAPLSESTMANTLESIRAQLLAIMAKLQLMSN